MENTSQNVAGAPQLKNEATTADKKNIIFLIAGLVGLLILSLILVSGYFWLKNRNKTLSEGAVAEDAAKGTLPSISNNPLENKPNLNPAENTNPIKGIKTNPFE